MSAHKETIGKTYDYFFKICLSGESGVGKTQIMNRILNDPFNPRYIPTIGIDFKNRSIELEGKIVKLHIWDNEGGEILQPRGSELYYPGLCYREVMGIMLIYDICNAQSFDKIPRLLKEIQEFASGEVQIILLGNKCDIEDQRQVNKDKGERFAREHGMKLMEVSARSSINIEEAFFTLAKMILDIKEKTNGSDDCEHEDGSDEYRPGNACALQ